MTTIAAVKNRLQSTAGVSPSRQWLEECLSALQISSSTDLEAAAASVLEQILSHDLRQVVRTTTATATQGSDNDDDGSCTMQLMLRRAIRQSQTGENRKAVLPESFRLLVQLEECLDVSSNAEARMAAVVSGSGGGNGASFGSSRCLKICYADGFYLDGKRQFGTQIHGNQADNSSIPCSLIAMEVSPIPDLSVQSPAGLKIILAGPITIRHGIAGWHSGNAIVLGGHAAEMVAIQRQALHAAQQRMGHGIDPTVKALIWNTMGSDDSQVLDGENDGACDVATKSCSVILASYLAAVFILRRSGTREWRCTSSTNVRPLGYYAGAPAAATGSLSGASNASDSIRFAQSSHGPPSARSHSQCITGATNAQCLCFVCATRSIAYGEYLDIALATCLCIASTR
jgi:RecQ mediated genome instability protein